MERRSGWIWRGAEVYLVIAAITALALAGWTFRYWSRAGTTYFQKLAPIVDRLGPYVEKNGLAGAAKSAATLFWAFGPIALPVAAILAGALLAFVRKRRRWAFAFALVLAALSLLFVLGGIQALHGLEDRHFYHRSPWVYEYKLFVGPLAVASAALLIASAVAGIVRARRPAA